MALEGRYLEQFWRTAIILTIVFSLGIWNVLLQETSGSTTNQRENVAEKQSHPYVILVSIDGFRHDYIETYDAPNLKSLAEGGVTAKSLIPSYPSMTFPNQYTLVTGMYPGNHGIVANDFIDPKREDRFNRNNPSTLLDGSWYGGTPLWVAAEQQGTHQVPVYVHAKFAIARIWSVSYALI